jgi:hypothetical protein
VISTPSLAPSVVLLGIINKLTEAEYYAMPHMFKEALWLRIFLIFLKFPVPRAFPIFKIMKVVRSGFDQVLLEY